MSSTARSTSSAMQPDVWSHASSSSRSGVGARVPSTRIAEILGLVVVGAAVVDAPRAVLLAAGLAAGLVLAHLPAVLLLCGILVARNLTDLGAAADSRATAVLNLSGMVGALCIVIAIGVIARSPHGVFRSTVLPTGAIVVFGALAVLLEAAPSTVMRESVRLVSILAVYFLASSGHLDVGPKRIARVVQAAAALPAAVALLQFASGHPRAAGTFSHPNSAAVGFALAVLCSVWLYADGGRHAGDALAALGFTGAVFSTRSIGGIGSLLFALCLFAVLRRATVDRKIALVVAGIGIALVFFLTPIGGDRLDEFSGTRGIGAVDSGVSQNSLEWRFQRWSGELETWRESPLLGSGLGSTTGGVASGQTLVHSEYVRLLVELGAIGVGIFSWAVAAGIRRLAVRRRLDGSNFVALTIAMSGGLLLNGLTSNTLLYTAPMYAFVALGGVAWNHRSVMPVDHQANLSVRRAVT